MDSIIVCMTLNMLLQDIQTLPLMCFFLLSTQLNKECELCKSLLPLQLLTNYVLY